jgi:putative component of membrane protein insertase Oxa1/YidC/SpoIIIJ protein YidD
MLIDLLISASIGGYQRYLSPYKGFCCAYRVQTGRRSCSAYARAIVDKLGAIALQQAMPRQFERCRLAFETLQTREAAPKKEQKWWERCNGGDCGVGNCVDLPCDSLPCDAVPCDCSF